jgi:hypothetical protein
MYITPLSLSSKRQSRLHICIIAIVVLITMYASLYKCNLRLVSKIVCDGLPLTVRVKLFQMTEPDEIKLREPNRRVAVRG